MNKKRYRSLDTMRGTAAIIVVSYHADALFHLGGWSPTLAFLAVDLFFCLSGFVLSKSYDDRIAGGLSAFSFMRARIQRLFPLYFLGWALGIIASLAAGTFPLTVETIVTSGLNGVMMPGIHYMFPTNPPAWSLFFELWIANLIFVLFWRHLQGWKLGFLIFAAFIGVIVAEQCFHDLNLGYDWPTVGGGLARVMFSFFAGVAVSRYHAGRPCRGRIPEILILVSLVGVLSISGIGKLQHVQQVVCVVVFFPIIIFLSAGSAEKQPMFGIALGDASYALYVLHWPLLMIYTRILRQCSVTTTGFGVQLLLMLAILLVALTVHHWYDMPVRRLIANRQRRRALSVSQLIESPTED